MTTARRLFRRAVAAMGHPPDPLAQLRPVEREGVDWLAGRSGSCRAPGSGPRSPPGLDGHCLESLCRIAGDSKCHYGGHDHSLRPGPHCRCHGRQRPAYPPPKNGVFARSAVAGSLRRNPRHQDVCSNSRDLPALKATPGRVSSQSRRKGVALFCSDFTRRPRTPGTGVTPWTQAGPSPPRGGRPACLRERRGWIRRRCLLEDLSQIGVHPQPHAGRPASRRVSSLAEVPRFRRSRPGRRRHRLRQIPPSMTSKPGFEVWPGRSRRAAKPPMMRSWVSGWQNGHPGTESVLRSRRARVQSSFSRTDQPSGTSRTAKRGAMIWCSTAPQNYSSLRVGPGVVRCEPGPDVFRLSRTSEAE